ncbi:MAG TPA: hypothetical protein VKS78_13415 [Roseiarcus sp.]|nr:hypothetical protein [Roseiarcus sp.]
MNYVLEFFWINEDGGGEPVARQSCYAPSADIAESLARATMKYVLIDGRQSNLCVIKNPRGRILLKIAAAVRRIAPLHAIDPDLSVEAAAG